MKAPLLLPNPGKPVWLDKRLGSHHVGWRSLTGRKRKHINMTAAVKPLTSRKAWKALESHCQKSQVSHLRQLFAADPRRGSRMTVEGAGLFLDYSKNRITDETLELLFDLAKESGLR